MERLFNLVKVHVNQAGQNYNDGGALQKLINNVFETQRRDVIVDLATAEFTSDFSPQLLYQPDDDNNPYRNAGGVWVFSKPDNLLGLNGISPKDRGTGRYRFSEMEILHNTDLKRDIIIDRIENPFVRGFFDLKELNRWSSKSLNALALKIAWHVSPSISQEMIDRDKLERDYDKIVLERKSQDILDNPGRMQEVRSTISQTVGQFRYGAVGDTVVGGDGLFGNDFYGSRGV